MNLYNKIYCINYKGGSGGEFITSQIKLHYPGLFWTNLHTQSFPKWLEYNRYKSYWRTDEDKHLLPLSPFWKDENEIIDFYKNFCDSRKLIVRNHRLRKISEFPFIVIYCETFEYFIRMKRLAKIKIEKTENRILSEDDHPSSTVKEWLDKNGWNPNVFRHPDASHYLSVESFLDLSGLHILEEFLGITYTDEMKKEILEYKKRDDALLAKYG